MRPTSDAGGDVCGRVEKLLPGGEGLVHASGRAWLVANVAPGDIVRLSPHGKRRGMFRGGECRIVTPSPLRTQPLCDVAEMCGGCALACVDARAHATIKSTWVHEAFACHLEEAGAGGCEWRGVEDAPRFGERRRVRLWRGQDGAGAFLGFRARASHQPVRAAHCPAIHPFIESLRLALGPRLPCAVGSVRATVLTHGAHVVLECPSSREVSPNALKALIRDVARGLNADCDVAWWARIGTRLMPLMRPIPEVGESVPAGDGTLKLRVGPDDFVQGTMRGHAALVGQVASWTADVLEEGAGWRRRRVADLFCGIGNLSLPLAVAPGCSVRGADACVSSIRQANRTARALGLDAVYETANLFDAFDTAPFAGADVLLLDPPRKGAKAVCERLGGLLPRAIIMVHCDPAAGRRDAAAAAGLGYRLRALRAIDLFPWTGHVESLSLWTQ